MAQTGRDNTSGAVKAIDTTIRGVRATARGGARFSRFVKRHVLLFRHRSAAGELGMMRLLDLHVASCAGDALVTIGLASTTFFAGSVGQARGKVALYLFITMVPFAVLAPVVGPVLDRFRHGRRIALSITMLGRALLAWMISDYLHNFGLYPAAFGVLALSRAYGVARSAAVPRLLPPGLSLSEAGARASIFGTLAGAAVAPLGLAATALGPQWPLRVAAVIFVIGAVVALRLPPRADSDAPEVVPRAFQSRNRRHGKVLSGPLVVTTVVGAASLRALSGFVTLYLAFAIRAGDLTTSFFKHNLSRVTALAVAFGCIWAGSLVATAIGSRLNIRRPILLQAVGTLVVTISALYAIINYTLGSVIIFGLSGAIVAGLSKLALDATIQERVPEEVRASGFAHSETLLMLAWVAGGAIGLIPFAGRLGIGTCAIGMGLATFYVGTRYLRLRQEQLGRQARGGRDGRSGPDTTQQRALDAGPTRALPPGSSQTRRVPARTVPAEPEPATRAEQATTRVPATETSRWSRRRSPRREDPEPQTMPAVEAPPTSTTTEAPPTARVMPRPGPGAPERDPQPGYHLYRPSSRPPDDPNR